MIELNLQPPLFPQRSPGGVESPIASSSPHLIRINPGMVQRHLLWVSQDTPVTQEIPRAFEGLCKHQGQFRSNAMWMTQTVGMKEGHRRNPSNMGTRTFKVNFMNVVRYELAIGVRLVFEGQRWWVKKTRVNCRIKKVQRVMKPWRANRFDQSRRFGMGHSER